LDKETLYWVGFSLVPGIGRVRFGLLENHFGSLANAWTADSGEFKRAGLDAAAINNIIKWRPRISLEREEDKLEQHGVQAVTCHDDLYPSRLKEIYDYPPVLYVRGTLLTEQEWCLAVVGTRKATVYGRQVTDEFVTELARNGITVVSGLARGIDSVAHKSALDTGARTYAVFACGLDTIYPAENAGLARRIMENGALISEYPLGTKPRPEHFPRRNRIMSGMSLGVLVIEANKPSGALVTANRALEQNREVFAVPGSILSPASRGTNHLIQEGAKLVRDYTDILEELNLTVMGRQMEMKEIIPATDTEAQLLQYLSAEPTHIDTVCISSGLPAATVSSALSIMELKGLVKHVGAMNYTLAREARREYRVAVD
jgi:DNA processing protein